MKKQTVATVYTDLGSVALVLESIKRDKDRLVVNGKVLGTMSMDMIIPVEEVFNVLKLALCRGVISYLFLLPYYGIVHAFKRKG